MPRLDRLLSRWSDRPRVRYVSTLDLVLPYRADQLHLTLAGHAAFGDAVAGGSRPSAEPPVNRLLRALGRAGYGSQAGGVTTAAVGWLRTANGSRPGSSGPALSRRTRTLARIRSMWAWTVSASSSAVGVEHRLREA